MSTPGMGPVEALEGDGQRDGRDGRTGQRHRRRITEDDLPSSHQEVCGRVGALDRDVQLVMLRRGVVESLYRLGCLGRVGSLGFGLSEILDARKEAVVIGH